MGNVRLGVPEKLALALRDAGGLRVFIETGTYKGGTTTWAAQHFPKVVTIEAHQPYHEKAKAANWNFKNISWVLGNSRTELRVQLGKAHQPCLLWLDAHWCGNASYGHKIGEECPLMEELAAVTKDNYADEHAILIDDARLFEAPPPYPHDPKQWPTMVEIKRVLDGRVIVVHDDVIVAVPRRHGRIVLRWKEEGGG